MTFKWTKEAEAKLKRLYVDNGMSASEVALTLGHGCTRSSVTSKASRMKLLQTYRRPAAQPKALKAPEVKRDLQAGAINVKAGIRQAKSPRHEADRQVALQKAQASDVISMMAATAANDVSVLLIERRRFQCAWPLGDPERPSAQMCCGAPVAETSNTAVESYCAAHAQEAVSRNLNTKFVRGKAYERSVARWAA